MSDAVFDPSLSSLVVNEPSFQTLAKNIKNCPKLQKLQKFKKSKIANFVNGWTWSVPGFLIVGPGSARCEIGCEIANIACEIATEIAYLDCAWCAHMTLQFSFPREFTRRMDLARS